MSTTCSDSMQSGSHHQHSNNQLLCQLRYYRSHSRRPLTKGQPQNLDEVVTLFMPSAIASRHPYSYP
ncbi:protein of unknown function (plasmid) [Cupriavidus taiwanensis]|uniref:Uncharacterized protein n=1 Tax=Cupriavidus taiwanensis TaxID=164546 RepID=A0A7Z7JCH6_9BURK|nr:protein of unknown function [Cupriavidus taiwanensis]SOZ11889.1 protein of unknown function [Cupriavidus taiwanensis]SOZ43244.1 protein of unknown function [Cupriavidus taiwanensis]SPC22490.1 protein of unknown function [Cupriavidus taiwanensis]SPD53999.1 protein of unknown function [Cupriavidus taiwanensis]